jgi:hypothetical protein
MWHVRPRIAAGVNGIPESIQMSLVNLLAEDCPHSPQKFENE